MTDLPDLESNGRGWRRVDLVHTLTGVIRDQAEYIEQLELYVDELEGAPRVEVREPTFEEAMHGAGLFQPEPEPEDPRFQILRDMGVSEDEIERMKLAQLIDESSDDQDQGLDTPEALADLVAQVRHAAPKLVLTRPAAEPEDDPPAPRARPRKVNAPRAERPHPGHRIASGDDDNPFKNGAIPGVSAQAAVVLNQPLKTTRPRKASGHKIPEGMGAGWKKDGAGRRVPIDTPEES